MSAAAGSVVAQAKINLFLRVGARQPDGYHDLQTLFQRIDLGDSVALGTGGDSRTLECRGAEMGPPEQNLAYRAAALFGDATGWPGGFSISLEKRVPVGGGLGGGSADAAAVLRILNHLAPAPLAADALQALALRLGADVPYLVTESPLSLGGGRGERLTQVAPLPVRGVTLLLLPFSVSTREAFGWLDEARAAELVVLPSTPGDDSCATWSSVAAAASNDFEAAVSQRHPRIGELLALLRSQNYEMVGLSGSGSTLFAISRDESPAPVRARLPLDVRQVFTRTSDRVFEVGTETS